MDYVSIRVSTLRGDQKIRFNVYVKIADRMILYLRDGDSFEGARLKRLKDKKVKKIFILNDDEIGYRDYLQNNIEQAYDNKSGKDVQTRAEIIQGAQENNVDEVFENPENAESYNFAKDSAGKYVQFLLSNSDAVKSVMNVENTDQSIAHHGVNVSTLAVALAHRLNVVDPKQIQLLALGGLLHDFGHMDAQAPGNVPLAQLSPEDLKIYKTHPQFGASKVQDKKHFDQAVLNIIMKHEECIDGSGFPSGLRESEQDILVQIISSCNALDRLISFEKVSKLDAPKKMMLDQVGKHPLPHIQHLAEIVRSL